MSNGTVSSVSCLVCRVMVTMAANPPPPGEDPNEMASLLAMVGIMSEGAERLPATCCPSHKRRLLFVLSRLNPDLYTRVLTTWLSVEGPAAVTLWVRVTADEREQILAAAAMANCSRELVAVVERVTGLTFTQSEVVGLVPTDKKPASLAERLMRPAQRPAPSSKEAN